LAGPGVTNTSAKPGRRVFPHSDDPQVVGGRKRGQRGRNATAGVSPIEAARARRPHLAGGLGRRGEVATRDAPETAAKAAG